LPILWNNYLNESYLTHITYFQVTGTPLRPRDHCYGSRADYVTNINSGLKQFVTTVGIYAAQNPL